MTREEKEMAINQLQDAKDGYKEYLTDDVLDLVIEFIEQEPCEDAISRSDILDAIGHGTTYTSEELQRIIKGLPPVNSQDKTGHWVKMPLIEAGQTYSHKCSLCGRRILITDIGLSEFPYCHCGAKMVEQQEREDNNG